MALTNAERQKRHKAKLRGNVTGNGVTESNEPLPMSNEMVTEIKALWLAINGITERLDKLEASKPKVVVSPRGIMPAVGLSKEHQASGKVMPYLNRSDD